MYGRLLGAMFRIKSVSAVSNFCFDAIYIDLIYCSWNWLKLSRKKNIQSATNQPVWFYFILFGSVKRKTVHPTNGRVIECEQANEWMMEKERKADQRSSVYAVFNVLIHFGLFVCSLENWKIKYNPSSYYSFHTLALAFALLLLFHLAAVPLFELTRMVVVASLLL